MKKSIVILILAILFTMALASCSGASTPAMTAPKSETNSSGSGYEPVLTASRAPTAMQDAEMQYYENDSSESEVQMLGESGVVPLTATSVDGNLTDKIIYTVSADIETVNFDETIEGVYKLLTDYGGFVENSNIGGRNYAQSYYGWQTYRSARFTLRVPKDQLNTITSSLEDLGNVTSLRSDAENVTAQFFDTQSRLNSYRTQEERLLDMLAKSDNVTDMVTIEARLADIRYEIESLTSTLRNWQNQVDYSSVILYVSEVETFTEIEPIQQRTYWQQIGDGLKVSTRGVGDFFKELFKFLAINLPVIIILAVVVVVILIIVKRQIKRGANRITQNYQYPQHQYNPQYPQYPQPPQNQQNPYRGTNQAANEGKQAQDE